MAPRHRVIIDTDPGVDDILAMLLALSAQPDELEVLLISVTYGNVQVTNCLRNVVTLFHHISLEMKWRAARGLDLGFETLRKTKPVVAVGASGPLAEHQLMADYFHGNDGLGGIHQSHPELSPLDTWHSLFDSLSPTTTQDLKEPTQQDLQPPDSLFLPSNQPAHEVILDLLQTNDADTITIVAIGPATNLATAAAKDPETFLRAKEVVVMGGAINESGNVGSSPPPLINPDVPCPPVGLVNAPPGILRTKLIMRNQITPVAEFNVFADSLAAARLLSLTSPNPRSTMPPIPSINPPLPTTYPARLSRPSRPLRLTLFPLDLTIPHALHSSTYSAFVGPRAEHGSPLAIWISAFLSATFQKLAGLYKPDAPLSLHDPLCVWYLLAPAGSFRTTNQPEDVRIETGGQWTRGMCVVDRRGRMPKDDNAVGGGGGGGGADGEVSLEEVPGDTGNWLRKGLGNRVWRCVDSDWKQQFGEEMLRRIFAA